MLTVKQHRGFVEKADKYRDLNASISVVEAVLRARNADHYGDDNFGRKKSKTKGRDHCPSCKETYDEIEEMLFLFGLKEIPVEPDPVEDKETTLVVVETNIRPCVSTSTTRKHAQCMVCGICRCTPAYEVPGMSQYYPSDKITIVANPKDGVKMCKSCAARS